MKTVKSLRHIDLIRLCKKKECMIERIIKLNIIILKVMLKKLFIILLIRFAVIIRIKLSFMMK